MKKFLTIFIIIALLLALCGCSVNDITPSQPSIPTATKLTAPSINSQIVDNIVRWSSVPNADAYIININGVEARTTDLSYPIYGLIYESGYIAIKVMAKGNGTSFLDSEWSSIMTYNYKKDTSETPDNPPIVDPPIIEPPIEDNSALIEYLQKYHLLSGINVITGTYLDANSISSNDFLDMKKIANIIEVGYSNPRAGKLETITSQSMSSFASQYSSNYSNSTSASLGIKGDLFGFTTTLSSTFSIEHSFSISNNTNQFYYMSYQSHQDTQQTIKNFDKTAISNGDYIVGNVIAELDNILNKSGADQNAAILAMFDKYGTHLITNAFYGGKIEVFYYFLSNESKFNEQTATTLGSSIELAMGYSGINASLSNKTELKTALELNTSSSNTKTKFIVNYVGAGAISTSSFDKFDDAYSQWIKSYNSISSSDRTTMVDIAKDGLCPIWELLPEKYSSISNKMKEIFYNELSRADEEFLSAFPETKFFEGGDGSIDYPYQIAEPYQLKNVAQNLNAHYILTKDIDISCYSNWTPIGWNEEKGTQKTDYSFTGTFNGNGHKITGLSRILSPIYDKNDLSFVGLFASLKGAHIYDLILENVKFNFTNLDKPHSGSLNIGAIAGRIENDSQETRIERCSVSGSLSCGSNPKYGNNENLGGLIGHVIGNTSITHCANHSNISGQLYWIWVGGIVGRIDGGNVYISYCYNDGDISATCGWDNNQVTGSAGGIAGRIDDNMTANIIGCYAYCTLSLNNGRWKELGGIVGRAYNVGNLQTLKNNCYNVRLYYDGKQETANVHITLQHTILHNLDCFVSEEILKSGSAPCEHMNEYNSQLIANHPEFCWVFQNGQHPVLWWECN